MAYTSANSTPHSASAGSSISIDEFKNAMGSLASGVTIVSTAKEKGVHGMTATAVTSLSLDPPQLLVCVGKSARLRRFLLDSGRFVVNMLEVNQEPLAHYFAGAQEPDDPVPAHRFSELLGVPSLEGCNANLVCEVANVHEGGDHLIIVGNVVGTSIAELSGEPLLYYHRQFGTFEPSSDHNTVETSLNSEAPPGDARFRIINPLRD